MSILTDRANNLTRILCGELFKALGFSRHGFISRTLSPLAMKPIHSFSNIAVGFDQQVKEFGFQQASIWILTNFIRDMQVNIAQEIPRKGPLLIASNHPGAYDTLVITANIPRDDIKIIVDIPLDFINELPATIEHFLYAPPDPFIRMKAARSGISHLRNGGGHCCFLPAVGEIQTLPPCLVRRKPSIDGHEVWNSSSGKFRGPNCSSRWSAEFSPQNT